MRGPDPATGSATQGIANDRVNYGTADAALGYGIGLDGRGRGGMLYARRSRRFGANEESFGRTRCYNSVSVSTMLVCTVVSITMILFLRI